VSVEFSASGSEYLKTPGTSILSGLGAVTVACWVYPQNLDNHLWLLNAWKTSGGEAKRQVGFRIADGTGELLGFLWTTTTHGGDFDLTVSTDAWQHVAMTWDGSTLRGYVDGSSAGSKTYSFGGVVASQTDNELILARYDTTFANARVEDRAMWNRALSADEVAGLYSGRLRAMHIPAGLVHYWPLDVPGDASFGDFANGDFGGRDLVGDLSAMLGTAPAWNQSSPGLHWPSSAHVTPAGMAGGQTNARRVSIGGTFIDADRVVLAG